MYSQITIINSNDIITNGITTLNAIIKGYKIKYKRAEAISFVLRRFDGLKRNDMSVSLLRFLLIIKDLSLHGNYR